MTSFVDLYWLPLGADGNRLVAFSGRVYEAFAARFQHRVVCGLYHSALIVGDGSDSYVIEMGPAWGRHEPDRGVVATGPVGLAVLGRSRLFRYEVRCWKNGILPDIAKAVSSPQRLSTSPILARRVMHLAARAPELTWGRDQLHAGDQWNSNSLVSWLLAASGHNLSRAVIPEYGRAPGWAAGLALASSWHTDIGVQAD